MLQIQIVKMTEKDKNQFLKGYIHIYVYNHYILYMTINIPYIANEIHNFDYMSFLTFLLCLFHIN